MSTSYDGAFMFGAILGDDDDETEMPWDEEGSDFDTWANEFLGVGKYTSHDSYAAYKEARLSKMVERWGCAFTSDGWFGVIDWHVNVVHPEDARITSYRYGEVPEWSQEKLAFWRECFDKLRQDIPNMPEPKLYFGCEVG